MAVSITGLTFTAANQGNMPNSGYACFTGTGTYTAADFTIDASDGLGFTPFKVRVCNLTDRTETVAVNAAAFNASGKTDPVQNATTMIATDEGLKTIADGTRTYADHGVAISGAREITIDVSVAGPITDNDDFIIECWA